MSIVCDCGDFVREAVKRSMSLTRGSTGRSGQPGRARGRPSDSKRSLLSDGGWSQRQENNLGNCFQAGSRYVGDIL